MATFKRQHIWLHLLTCPPHRRHLPNIPLPDGNKVPQYASTYLLIIFASPSIIQPPKKEKKGGLPKFPTLYGYPAVLAPQHSSAHPWSAHPHKHPHPAGHEPPPLVILRTQLQA
ncbi:uncharacterized protein CLUP02_07169 [Colletotrichum lupini]|uniref:Uncharacterized protein n=1 Tax=Colletotrichum lupini TaxID=145971 RepID=A0A9Q8WFE4_9PEZI|nr:uncharacterized protein CLUP02_07169 [Colletotrichum lupini]UQC81683.1 hypothetical protein CLUP02_07169 [Colletotrichum lupini]